MKRGGTGGEMVQVGAAHVPILLAPGVLAGERFVEDDAERVEVGFGTGGSEIAPR